MQMQALPCEALLKFDCLIVESVQVQGGDVARVRGLGDCAVASCFPLKEKVEGLLFCHRHTKRFEALVKLCRVCLACDCALFAVSLAARLQRGVGSRVASAPLLSTRAVGLVTPDRRCSNCSKSSDCLPASLADWPSSLLLRLDFASTLSRPSDEMRSGHVVCVYSLFLCFSSGRMRARAKETAIPCEAMGRKGCCAESLQPPALTQSYRRRWALLGHKAVCS